ncbi:MAG: TatD family hydrolase [Dysgonamonadaceae bacterium]|jgi:TatD DNase family protein|nr:TatD family hydrolase [Dysgonamonadaceae bacterium]
MELYDIHTHQVLLGNSDESYRSCILNVYPFEFETAKELYKQYAFSCGIHPWYSENSDMQMTYLSKIASDPSIVAIGETGLDKLKGASFDVQIAVFKKHIELSEKLQKPVIVHCVKAWEDLIRVHRETKPTQPWIIHGYRGKPELTKQLIKEKLMFSVGEKINSQSMPLIPIDSLFCETDEGEMNIQEVYFQVAKAVNMNVGTFAGKIAENAHRVFPTLETPKAYKLKKN